MVRTVFVRVSALLRKADKIMGAHQRLGGLLEAGPRSKRAMDTRGRQASRRHNGWGTGDRSSTYR
jgi:hypothetical protein